MHTAPDLLFKTLGDPTRRAIFERLAGAASKPSGMLTERSDVSQPAVSKHLGVLKLAGLVRDRREGRQTHYSAEPEALAPVDRLDRPLRRLLARKFDHLEDLLKRMDQ